MDERLMAEHMKYLRLLNAEGHILTSGTVHNDGAMTGMITLLLAPSPEAVRELMSKDPFMTSGIIKDVSIRKWTPIIGTFVENDTIRQDLQ